tara:strand:- start:696 stop:1172 length:477 start_codon:yes stop_codon:yes gene_type:complete
MQTPLIKTLIWVLVAIITSVAIQIPMLWHGDYAFLYPNLLIVFISIMSIRNSFEFYNIGFHRNKWSRYFLFVLNIFIFLYILNRLEIVLGVIDSMDVKNLISSSTITFNETVDVLKYVNKEYLFFSIASFVGLAIYNLRLLASFWKLTTSLKRERKLT